MSPGDAVNVNDVLTTFSAGVVTIAFEVSEKSDHNALSFGATLIVHTMPAVM